MCRRCRLSAVSDTIRHQMKGKAPSRQLDDLSTTWMGTWSPMKANWRGAKAQQRVMVDAIWRGSERQSEVWRALLALLGAMLALLMGAMAWRGSHAQDRSLMETYSAWRFEEQDLGLVDRCQVVLWYAVACLSYASSSLVVIVMGQSDRRQRRRKRRARSGSKHTWWSTALGWLSQRYLQWISVVAAFVAFSGWSYEFFVQEQASFLLVLLAVSPALVCIFCYMAEKDHVDLAMQRHELDD